MVAFTPIFQWQVRLVYTYFYLFPEAVQSVQELIENSCYAGCRQWLTEYGTRGNPATVSGTLPGQ
jgi:hypothetical protein